MESKEIEKLNQFQSVIDEIQTEMFEMNQPRSDFALKHFVVGQHDLPARQREQVVVELQGLLFGLADLADEIKLAEIDIEDAKMKGMKGNSIDERRADILINQKNRAIENMRLQMAGRLRECETLYAILQKMPAYDREQYEAEETEYWNRRLARQYFLAQRDMGGNLTAILETLTEPGAEKPRIEIEMGQLCALMGLIEPVRKIADKGEK